MTKWSHKIDISASTLDQELNAYSEQGYEIFRLWKDGYDRYEIVAFKQLP